MYKSGKMKPEVAVDYLNMINSKHDIYQTIYQNDAGMISEEKAKTYSTWEVFLYIFSDTDKQVVVCVS